MKKCNLLVALVMAMTLFVTGCAKEETNPFPGKWTGTLDYTESFTELMTAENPAIKEFVKFENLTFTFVFEFTEENVSVHIDEASTAQFITNVETSIANMIDAMAASEASKNGVSVEEVFEDMGVSRDDYVAYTIKNMQLDSVVSAMVSAMELKGVYEYDEKQIAVAYDDKTYETLKYSFEGDALTVRILSADKELPIKCTKAE